jgi:hypothetical protein
MDFKNKRGMYCNYLKHEGCFCIFFKTWEIRIKYNTMGFSVNFVTKRIKWLINIFMYDLNLIKVKGLLCKLWKEEGVSYKYYFEG